MGWRTSDGNTSQKLIMKIHQSIGDLSRPPIGVLSPLDETGQDIAFLRFKTVSALYNADYQQQTTLTYCENNININTKLWKVQKL